MKKHLIAAAVAAAVAAPAMAQVTVYGIVETGIQSFDNGSSTYTRFSDGNINTSRLGFRGAEDLGSGLKAEFQLESRLNLSSGSAGAGTTLASATTTSNTQSEMFNREAWVGLSGSFGSIRLGRTDITNAVNVPTIVGTSGNFADAQSAVGADLGNTARYISPSFNGFKFEAGFSSASKANSINSADTTDGSVGDVNSVYAEYSDKMFKVAAGVVNKGAATINEETSLTRYGAQVDLGIAKVGLSYSSMDDETNADTKRKQTILSVAAPLGNGLTAHVVRNQYKDQASDKFTSNLVALTKDLSKRTYAAVYWASGDAASNTDGEGAINVLAKNPTADVSAIGITVGHKF